MKLGFSNAKVSRLLAVLSLPEAIRDQVQAGTIPASAAYELARVEDPGRQAALAEDLAGGRLTRDGLAGMAKAERNGQEQKQKANGSPCSGGLGRRTLDHRCRRRHARRADRRPGGTFEQGPQGSAARTRPRDVSQNAQGPSCFVGEHFHLRQTGRVDRCGHFAGGLGGWGIRFCKLSKWDNFTVADAYEGTAHFGGTGSGKSSGSGRTLALAYLRAGFGGLVLTAKTDERALWESYCRNAGRWRDLRIFSPTAKLRFNFLDYELNRKGAGAGLTDNLVALFSEILQIAERSGSSGGREDEGYWRRAIASYAAMSSICSSSLTARFRYPISTGSWFRRRHRLSNPSRPSGEKFVLLFVPGGGEPALHSMPANSMISGLWPTFFCWNFRPFGKNEIGCRQHLHQHDRRAESRCAGGTVLQFDEHYARSDGTRDDPGH